jgi:NADH:ubiquinone oxidoreductase subunit B-like Fe-S oxidoreductase
MEELIAAIILEEEENNNLLVYCMGDRATAILKTRTDKRCYSYLIDHTLWRTRFGRGCRKVECVIMMTSTYCCRNSSVGMTTRAQTVQV